jgi:tripartite-type tricarboxylate transporter receptor subunit TctC
MFARARAVITAAAASAFAMPALVIFALPFAVVPVRADPIADFYRGRQVNLLVGFSPGSVYDQHARLLARHLGRLIPGAPVLEVVNLPGAGSLRAVNHLYNTAARDGSVIGTFSRNMPLIGLVGGRAGVQFDPRKLTWLGSSSSFDNDAYILIVRKDAPVKTIEEARRQDLPALVLGGTSESSNADAVPIILRDTIRLHVKQVVGYPDSNATFLAIERGEVHGRTIDLSSLRASRPEWLKGDYRVLVQFARVTRHPDFPEVPTARELAKNEGARALIALSELPYTLSRPFAAPPELPPERAEALQKAFLAVHADPEFLADAARLRVDVSPIGGAAVLDAIERMASAQPELLDYVRRLLAETKGGG